MSRIYDAVVVGGGLAGSALAQRLAAAGRDVVVIERESGPHDKVCGEFLSHEAILYLENLGLEPRKLGAVPIETMTLASSRGSATCRLPFPALSLSRRRLDEALLQLANATGAELLRGTRVKALKEEGGTWLAQLDHGSDVRAREAFLATGKHELKGWKRPPGLQNDLIGLKLHLRLEGSRRTALDRNVQLAMFPGGYAGVEPIEGGRANLCLLIRKSIYQTLDCRWSALLELICAACPIFAERIQGAEPIHDRPLAVAAIPYGFIQRQRDGCWRLGDQAAVVPSFAGEGISIALHSASLAAHCYLQGESADMFQRRLATDVARQIRWAVLLSRILVHGRGQAIIAGSVRAVPGLLAMVASGTRIPASALRLQPGQGASRARWLHSGPRPSPSPPTA